ncbi:peptidylprolyl isomerase [Lactobacillus gallinarum]|uniref:Foldase protein PrsA n=2 Tax=Lactobacillus gallinarum TaxID=52242 RepID=A0A1Y4U9J8_9LACO|nr:peptidylprolyl isomerase [Lactobacillus gallinarum]KRL23755.1 foldase prsA [Lactobacillus gallinarum DSM 10532 = JCM 2011]MDM8277486.1 peptidylprolyl isomerase [Lactobacillus gallinarum]MDM8281643.1 peptidylprolyl isomerase [Lactobacillus gallinarum]OUQ54422.1 peptidylprolyl isomerase [Lactobacillus gallinarum]OUQ74451.1 peptidylprolyl isomerase [Lactobacillus gallinarum]
MNQPVKVFLTSSAFLLALNLTGCSKSNNTEVAQYGKNKKVTQEEFYKAIKTSLSSKTILANLLIYDALNEQYGKKLSSKAVNQEYNNYKERYGDQFASFLSQNGYTTTSFRRMIKINLLSKIALKAQIKPTNKQLKKEWKTYSPSVTVQHILTTDKNTANTVIQKLNNGTSFASLAQKYSVDSSSSSNGGKISAFNKDNKQLDSSFKEAAYKLKNGEYTTTPVKTTNGYEIIKMIKHPSKGSFEENKQDLINNLYDKWATNPTVMKNVISQTLKDQKVQIKDKDLESALDQYKGSTKSAIN